MQNRSDSSLVNTRSGLLDQLSAIVPFETAHNDNGTISISIAGHEVVKGMKQVAQLRCSEGTADHPSIISLVDEDGITLPDCDDISSSIKTGQLGAYIQLVNGTDSTKFSLQNQKKTRVRLRIWFFFTTFAPDFSRELSSYTR